MSTNPKSNPQKLRERHYNATVEQLCLPHSDLLVLRLKPDEKVPRYQAGQHTLLGLGYWEPRIEDCQEETVPDRLADRLVRRAYSFSSPLIDGAGRLVPPSTEDLPEFLIALVRRGERSPALTPRLFKLRLGDRLFMDSY